MNGCELPVVINSGSGNQGITASVPVIEYAKELNSGEEKLFRALVLSNLATIRSVGYIGREGMKETNETIIKMMLNEVPIS